jgi:hypothetical protein
MAYLTKPLRLLVGEISYRYLLMILQYRQGKICIKLREWEDVSIEGRLDMFTKCVLLTFTRLFALIFIYFS